MVRPQIYINPRIVSNYKETFKVDLDEISFTCSVSASTGNNSAIGVCSESIVRVKSIPKDYVNTFRKKDKNNIADKSLKANGEEKEILLTSPLVAARTYELARALSEGFFVVSEHL